MRRVAKYRTFDRTFNTIRIDNREQTFQRILGDNFGSYIEYDVVP